MNLEPFKGPQNIDDQFNTDRVEYLGDARIYTYFDKRLFLCELRAIDKRLSPETASERQYEQAPQNTSRTIFDSWARRSIVDEYRGPQSFVQRTCLNRANYTIDADTSRTTRRTDADRLAVNWLQCATCGNCDA